MSEYISLKKLYREMGFSKSYAAHVVREMKKTGKYRIIHDGRMTFIRECDLLVFMEEHSNEGSTT